MTTFTIDSQNEITALLSSQQNAETEEGTEAFSSPQELAALAATWPGSRLIEIWNGLPDVKPIERFTSRQVAITRIWKAIQNLQPDAGAGSRPVAPKKATAKNQASRRQRPAGRKDTKTAKVIALLQRPGGATLRTLMRATQWQSHSVRGFISGQLKKKFGLKVRSSKRDGERCYFIQ
jgi:hypothetical protein